MKVQYMLSNILGKDFLYSEVLVLEKANGTYEYIKDYAIKEEEGEIVQSLGGFLNYAKENEGHMYEGVENEDIAERINKHCKYVEIVRGNNEVHHVLHYHYQDIADLFLFGGDMELLMGQNIIFDMESDDKLHSFLVDFQLRNPLTKNFAGAYGIKEMYEQPIQEIVYALAEQNIEYHLQGSHYNPADYGGRIPKGLADFQRYHLQGEFTQNTPYLLKHFPLKESDVRFYLAEQAHIVHYAQQVYSTKEKAEQFQKIIGSEE